MLEIRIQVKWEVFTLAFAGLLGLLAVLLALGTFLAVAGVELAATGVFLAVVGVDADMPKIWDYYLNMKLIYISSSNILSFKK